MTGFSYTPATPPALVAAQAALAVPGATTKGTAAWTAATAAVAAAQVAIAFDIAVNDAGLAAIPADPNGNPFAVTPAPEAVANIVEAVALAGNLANLTALSGYVDRVAVTLANAGT